MAVKVHWFQIEPNLKEYEYEFTGLSTDEKPKDERVALNSLFLELDTGDFYYLKQAASSSTIKDTLLQNETVAGTKSGSQYEYQIENLYINADSITVILDGITYTCQKIVDGSENFYGAVDFDFSEYPFAISSAEEYNETDLYFPSDDEHVIEVYTEETVTIEAVWEKIPSSGGGGGGGGSFINKKISITVINNLSGMLTWACGYFISENEYVTTTTIEIPANSQIVQDLMIPMTIDDVFYYELPLINPTYSTVVASNPVNCTFNFSGGYQDLVVTDPTKDASVTLTYSRL